MSQYKVIIKEEAQADLKSLLRYEPKAYQKAMKFIGELYYNLIWFQALELFVPGIRTVCSRHRNCLFQASVLN